MQITVTTPISPISAADSIASQHLFGGHYFIETALACPIRHHSIFRDQSGVSR